MTRVLSLLALALTSAEAANADIPEEFEQQNWHTIEVVLFTQSWVSSNEHPEDLVREGPEFLSNDTITFPFNDEERRERFGNKVDIDIKASADPWFFADPRIDRQIPLEVDISVTDGQIEEHSELPGHQAEDCDPTLTECTSTKRTRYPDWLPPKGTTPESTIEFAFNGVFLGNWAVQHLFRELHPEETQTVELDEEEVVIDDDLQRQEEIAAKYREFQDWLKASQFTKLPHAQYFASAISRLIDNRQRVVFHAKWHQQIFRDSAPVTLYLLGGKIASNGMYEFEGTINITLRNYLHFDVYVWHYIPDQRTEKIFRLPVMELRETRRTRRNRTHFFDHPKFGMLVRADRVKLPDELLELVNESND